MRLITGIQVPALIVLILAVGRVFSREAPVFRESFVARAESPIPECYNPTAVCLPDGSLVCAWSSGSGRRALDTAIKISFLPAGERSWTRPVTVADEPGYPDDYPLLVELPGGTLRLLFATLYRERRKAQLGLDLDSWHLKYRDSHDGGRSWGGEFFLVPESDRVPAGRVVNLSGGGLLLPVTDLRRGLSRFLSSRDGGSYWAEAARVGGSAGLVDPVVVELEPSHLVAALRPLESGSRERRLWFTESRDGGSSWLVPRPSGLPNPGGSVDLVKLGNGHLVLAYNDHPSWLTPLTLALSTDGGRTWPYKRNVVTGQWDNRDPALVAAGDGYIHIIYVYRDNSLKDVEVNESWIMGD